jgi:hypothetical protein
MVRFAAVDMGDRLVEPPSRPPISQPAATSAWMMGGMPFFSTAGSMTPPAFLLHPLDEGFSVTRHDNLDELAQ